MQVWSVSQCQFSKEIAVVKKVMNKMLSRRDEQIIDSSVS